MTVDVARLVSGDTKPVMIVTLMDDESGTAYDLTPVDIVVYILFRASGTDVTLSKITCSVLGDGSTGQVQFDFSGGILDVPPGMYEGQIVIETGGTRHSVYDLLRFRVRESFTEPVSP